MMFLRKKFITNSSSTCFIAYGVEVEATDEDKLDLITGEMIEEEDGIAIVWSRLDPTYLTFYLPETELPANEYDFFQSIEHPELEEVVIKDAEKRFKQLAKKYGCNIIQGPHWGFYNSGH